MKVFVGGSKSLKSLPEAMLARLREFMGMGAEFLVGDCWGADFLIQRFLAEEGNYRNAKVYATEGEARYNQAHLEVRAVKPELSGWGRRFCRSDGYGYYSAKDKAMALDADFGLMAWDGRSRGTFINLVNMALLGKPVEVVNGNSDSSPIKSLENIRGILADRNPSHLSAGDFLPQDDYSLALKLFVPSQDMRACLARRPLAKGKAIELALGSPVGLETKLKLFKRLAYTDDVFHEVLDELAVHASKPVGSSEEITRIAYNTWLGVRNASFTPHRDEIRKALDVLHRRGVNDLVYRKSVWDEQPELFEEHEQGIAPFATFDEALEDLHFEMDDEEWDEDSPCWTIFEKWRRAKDGRWVKPYTYYAIEGEVVFFEKNQYDKELHGWTSADCTYCGDFTGTLNIPVPFGPGDIVTLDCRPFAPLRHCVVLEPDREWPDCCFPRVLSKGDGVCDLWHNASLKHQAHLHVSFPGYSVLYRAEVYDGELPEDERILKEVGDWIAGDAERGKALSDAVSHGMDDGQLREFMEGRTQPPPEAV